MISCTELRCRDGVNGQPASTAGGSPLADRAAQPVDPGRGVVLWRCGTTGWKSPWCTDRAGDWSLPKGSSTPGNCRRTPPCGRPRRKPGSAVCSTGSDRISYQVPGKSGKPVGKTGTTSPPGRWRSCRTAKWMNCSGFRFRRPGTASYRQDSVVLDVSSNCRSTPPRFCWCGAKPATAPVSGDDDARPLSEAGPGSGRAGRCCRCTTEADVFRASSSVHAKPWPGRGLN